MNAILRSTPVVAALALAMALAGATACNKNNGGHGGSGGGGGGGSGGGGGGSASGLTMTLTVPATVTTSTPQSVHVAVANADGTAATSYTGTVVFTSTDTVAYLPAQYTFTAADAGGHDFSTTFNSAGSQTLTSTDSADAGLNANASTAVSGPAYYYLPPTTGKIVLVPNAAMSTPTLAVLDLVAMVDLTGYFVGFDVAVDGTKLAPDASLMTKGNALDPGTNPPAIAGAIPTTGPLTNALVTGLSQKASGNGAITADATVKTGSIFYTLQLPLKAGAAGGTIMDGTVAANKIRAGLRNKVGTEVVGVADFGIGKLVFTP